jgi:hypothetical protein
MHRCLILFNLSLRINLKFFKHSFMIIALALVIIFNLLLNSQPTFAHKVEISEDVGATLHIEPNDNPKAGETSQIWFALTKEGGEVIPLTKCACVVSIFADTKSSVANKKPILQPPLKPLSAEGYKNIPSAKVTFPKIGRYDLEITGKSIGGDDFKPFKLNFKIMIATAISQVSPTVPNSNLGFNAVNPDRDIQLIPILTGVGVMAIASVIIILRINRINK